MQMFDYDYSFVFIVLCPLRAGNCGVWLSCAEARAHRGEEKIMQKEGALTGFVAFVFGVVLFVCSFITIVVSKNAVIFFVGLVSLFAAGTFLAFNVWLDNRLAERARKRFLSKFAGNKMKRNEK